MNKEELLSMISGLDDLFKQKTGNIDLLTFPLGERLGPVASAIEAQLSALIAERQRVTQSHPYIFGMLLLWLTDPVASIGDTTVSRFEVFQRGGYWPHVSFSEWATEMTGVDKKTWRQWVNVCKGYFASEQGAKIVEKAGGLQSFVDTVPMDKAVRAVSTVARGEVREHHVEALLDPSVTSESMRYALKSTPVQWEDRKAEEEEKEREWVEKGDRSKKWVDYDIATRVVKLKRVDDNGVYSEEVIARFPVASIEVTMIQEAMIAAAVAGISDAASAFNTLIKESVVK